MDAEVAGNVSADELKRTLVDAAMAAREAGARDRYIVAEISSFQLEYVEKFRPFVAMLTNVTPDHLNQHNSFEEYAAAKENLFRAQTEADFGLYGADNAVSAAAAEHGYKSKAVRISAEFTPPAPAAYLHNGWLTCELTSGEQISLLPVDDIPATLPGKHSISNALMAGTAAAICGADPQNIGRAIRAFKGVAHRMEIVAEHQGIRYINNSMCTNVAAAIASIQAVQGPCIVIAGGADKELDFAPLAPVLDANVQCTVLIGSAADKMETAFKEGGYTRIVRADSLEAAVATAASLASAPCTVLLAPACASFDMFRDFEHRGEVFRQTVTNLIEGGIDE